ncbi:MAG: neutral/alkaline non-lysosomal ceramidase N-terminal domain-containing protein [Clostridia bacterium]|nr:neutral/alkaline non-lysosomal ceramidase N-terminal domain-containing protein [Clostridia bacterium]
MFEFGFYEKEITPPLGSGIPGYFNIRRGCDVLDRLYARAVVIKNDNEKVAILSIDGLHPKKDICDKIAERIEAYTKIPRKNIMIGFTHSHTALPFRFERIAFEDDEIVADSIKGYAEVFVRLVADCATLASLRLKKATAHFGKGTVEGVSFCRDYFMKNGTPQTNPTRMSPEIMGAVTEADKDLPVLVIKDEQHQPIGAILSFACHGDCIGGEGFSGDYVSILSKELKRTYGEDFVSVFLLGCCGDVNHIDVSKKSDAADHYKMMGKKVADEAVRIIDKAKKLKNENLKSKLEYIPIKRIDVEKQKIEEAKHCIATIKEKKGVRIAADSTDPEQYQLAMAKRLVDFLETTPEEFEVPVQCIQIGEFTIYGFNSEIFTEFGKIVKKGDGTGINLIATLCNEAFGYVPTRDMFFDTIYESRPGSNRLEKEAGYIMAEKLISMKEKLT